MVACRGTPFRVRGGSWDGSSSMGDCRKCQTSTASPAKPGGLPVMLARQLHAQPSRQFLRELPGDAAGARTTCGRPFQRFALEFGFIELDAEVTAITLHHGEVLVLAAAVEAEP